MQQDDASSKKLGKLAKRLESGRVRPSFGQRLRRFLALNVDDALKRMVDVLVSGAVLLLFLPVWLVIAILVKLDGGPVLYWQTRVGLNGREFPFPKIRSMVVNADALRVKLEADNEHGGKGVTFKMENDPRITRVGRFLRRTSLDEIPQLWCVFNGEMSLVGPRPALPIEVARYTVEQRRRLEAKPGLTCIWQVSGRSQIPFEGQIMMDLEYIRTRSFTGDLVLLAKTIPAVFFGRGAS